MPTAHEMVAPGNLAAVLDLIASAPGEWTPIAGGTELMVAFASGRLSARKLVSLWGVPELRFIETKPESIAIGAGTTFLDLRAACQCGRGFSTACAVGKLDWFGSEPEPRYARRKPGERFACGGLLPCAACRTTRRSK